MKIGLVVPKISKDIDSNLNNILNFIDEGSNNGAELLIFPETTLTGFVNNDDPEHDIKLGLEDDDLIIITIRNRCKSNGISILLGYYEKNRNYLYDSAIFIGSDGEIIHKFRRLSMGWRDHTAINSIYKEGSRAEKVETEMGSFSCLICGDLFDDNFTKQVKDLCADYMFYPYARELPDLSKSQNLWDNEELPAYIEQIKKCGTPALMCNFIDESYCGGAFVISGDGEVLASKSLDEEGILYYEL